MRPGTTLNNVPTLNTGAVTLSGSPTFETDNGWNLSAGAALVMLGSVTDLG